MSLLGKILAVLNVLAAIGFLAVAGIDWGQKQLWADAYQQRQLALNGLPVDNTDKDREGRPRADDLRKPVLDNLFRGAGSPVRTQDAEVEQVKNRLQGQVEAAGAQKPQKLIEVLWYLATTEDERERLAQLRTVTNPDVNTLQDQLNQAFAWVSQPPPGANFTNSFKKSEPPVLPLEDKRHRIANLLFRLTPLLAKEENPAPADLLASQAYNRFLAVVGVAEAARAVDEQAQALHQFYDDAVAGINDDRNAFVAQQQTLLAQIDDLRGRVADQQRYLKEQKDLLAQQSMLVADRQQVLTRLTEQLTEARNETKKQLETQQQIEQQLFKSREAYRNAFEKNQELERQIRELEKGR